MRGEPGASITDVTIQGNDFYVTNENVGENGIDLKTVHGGTVASDDTIHGFRPCEPGQDSPHSVCSPSSRGAARPAGSGNERTAAIVIQAGARGVTVGRETSARPRGKRHGDNSDASLVHAR
jgi:hypothetical protein